MLFKRIFSILSLFLFTGGSILLPAQNKHVIDSVNGLLKTAITDSMKCRLLVLIGNEYMASNPDTTILIASRSLEIAQSARWQYGAAAAYNQLGTANRLKGEFVTSLSNYLKGLEELKEDSMSVQRAKILNNLGSTYKELGAYNTALDCFQKAALIFDAAGTKIDAGKAYGNIGSLYFTMDKLEKAREYEQKAYTLFQELGFKPGLAGVYGNSAGTLRKMKRFDEAIASARKSIAISRQIGNKRAESVALEVIANTFHETGAYDSALVYYDAVIRLRDSISDRNGANGANINIGELLNRKGDHKAAIRQFERILPSITELHNIRQLEDIYAGMADAYEKDGNLAKALYCQKETMKMRDSLLNDEKSKEMTRKEMQFEFSLIQAGQEKEKAIAAQEARQQRMLTYAFMIGFALMLALAYVAFRGYRNKKKAHLEINRQKILLEEKNKDITDSITYARRIQAAVLPDDKIIASGTKAHELIYRPRDIVSGDFYWYARKNNFLYIAAADCTGHGVPGALVSVVGINALQQLIEQDGSPDTSALLGKLHRQVIMAMNKDVNLRETQDGMDIGLVRIDLEKKTAQFSGAVRPLFYTVEGKNGVQQLNGDRMSIAGNKHFDDSTPYTLHEIPLEGETTFYLFTDGIVDQFGGEKGKKFLTRRLLELLESMRHLGLREQREIIERQVDEWKNQNEQTDDILLLSFTV